MAGITIGELSQFVQLARSQAGTVQITDFDPLFAFVEDLLTSYGQLTPDIKAGLELAKQELKANLGLFQVGNNEFINSIDALLAKYPPATFVSDIPELSGIDLGTDGGTGTPSGLTVETINKLFSEVKVTYDAATKSVVVVGTGYQFQQTGIDRLKFDDGTVAFDTLGNAGQAYRLYQAAFERDPDVAGLGHWIKALDGGAVNLRSAANDFINSVEFIAKFGTPQTVDNSSYVELLYKHTLGRAAEQAGVNFWVDELEANRSNRAELLAQFSESNENKAQVAAEISDGIWFV